MTLQDKKKILVFDKFLGYNVGGAQKSLHKLLEQLDGNFFYLGCDVKTAFGGDKFLDKKWSVERFKITECPRFPYWEYWLNRKKIKKEIENRKEDFLLTQGLWGAAAARFFPGKVIYFVRDEYQLNNIPITQKGLIKFFKFVYLFFQLPFILVLFNDNRAALKKSSAVIANSQFIKNQIAAKFSVESEVVYPMVDTESSERFERGEFITSIGTEEIKGRKIVEAVAQLMPNYKFMIVGRDVDEPIWKDNIQYVPWENEVKKIYQKTRLLLAPSLCNEAFGRTALEAMVLGIPVLGTNFGGLPEVLTEEGVVTEVGNCQEWKKKISNALENKEKYIRKDLGKFSLTSQVNNFKRIMKEVF